MRKLIKYFAVLLLLNSAFVFGFPKKELSQAPAAPFSRGVNFNGWFEGLPKSAGEIFNKYSAQDFIDVKKMGIDVIRLPIDFFVFTSGAPDYKIDPLLFKLLGQAVDWAEENQLYIILDFHPEGQPSIDPGIVDFLLPVWRQTAEHFKNRGEYVIYEILNEPHTISSGNWGEIQGKAITEIRKIDQSHWIVAGGVEYNSIDALASLPKYADNKLLYTFHFYEPYVFTHQGNDNELENLSGVPFPYKIGRMPETPKELKGTWAEKQLGIYYALKGTRSELSRLIKKASAFGRQRNVPVFCGEFGALLRYSLQEDRVTWYKTVRELFDENNIPWIKWSYYDCLGMFHSQLDGAFTWQSAGDINYDLNIELTEALGLNPVPQQKREQLRSDFVLFDDKFGRGVRINYLGQNTINMYYTQAAEGQYAIHLGNLKKHDLSWDGLTLLLSVMDLSHLVRNGYVLEFKAKTVKSFPVDVIFYCLKDGVNWQLGYTIDQRHVPPDGEWHTVRIPLENMKVWGGMDIKADEYVEYKGGSVLWDKINLLEFLAKQEDSVVRDLYLDSIKITR